MVNRDTAAEVIFHLLQDPSNHICQDCLSADIKFASVNHGIFLCEACAAAHQTLGTVISFVKPLKETWSIRQLKLLKAGGNSRFKSFLLQYGIDGDLKIGFKYFTKAASYYREKIKFAVEGESYNIQAPCLAEGLLLITGHPLLDFKSGEKRGTKKEGLPDVILGTISCTLGFGQKVIETAQSFGQGVLKEVKDEIGMLDKKTEEIKKGVDCLKDGTLDAICVVTDAAFWTYHKLKIDEIKKFIKTATMLN